MRAWREQGVDAPLFLGRPAGAMRAELARDLSFTMPPQPRFDTGPFETLWMITTLPRAVRQLRPDILFCAGNSYTIVAAALKLLLGRHCPPIVAKISNDLDRRDLPPPVRWCYRLWLRIQGRVIDHFVGMDHPMMQEIGEAMRCPMRAITIIPDPALSDALIARLRAPRPPAAPRGRRFVAIARLAAQKNIALMLRAFAAGRRAGDRLTIFGEGPERPAAEKAIVRLGLENAVILAGHVPDPALRLPDFDIFLLSSDYEGVPAAILEALAANLTIVATRCSRSMDSLLGQGKLGMIVPPGDERALGDAIGQARPGAQDAAESLAQARRFTIERASRAYLACFAANGANGARDFSRD